ncbi:MULTISPECIES: succinate dehydrogenase cytochrome b subunit [unclassified Corynebacterium]|uniref:succinate dehydrogenase cytochrome b subunit n=1 Tax=unclassified Corynebacterium TaxID=2624378 RepID=UPI001C43F134|nr:MULTISPECIES: succinate dehydrogenase cytochrome b subunit [unclassified Corynebacterium]MBV7282523.1 succinate dehydrogenase cytochrome b subunit [Corynebacterium sp. TAE3-ERU30]MBV7302129.1 succinate dehydrogenase cytochrome b subunit [Corynebacterium sp. TAE3-ERU2]
MTVKYDDRDAIAHGKITEKPLRERPGFPTWAVKLTMAITGLIFAGFVVVHMVGNLKIFLPDHDGRPALDEYGEFFRTVGEPVMPYGSVLWILRIVLLVGIVLHIWGAFTIVGRAHQSRGKFRRTNKMGGLQSFATQTMIVTGIVLLAFIIFHILDLTVGVQPAASASFEHGEVYANVVATFSRPAVAIFYIIAQLCLFLHLTHGMWVAVSDLGIVGKRWRAVLSFVAYLVPAIVLIGNVLIPVAVLAGWVS